MKLYSKTNKKYRTIKRILIPNIVLYSSVILMLSGFLNINSMTGKASIILGPVIISLFFLYRYFNDKKMKTIDRGLVESLR